MDITDVGHQVATVQVQIGPQFLNLFSEHLYSSPNKAFEELVSNSWDAGARNVYIGVPDNLHAPDAALWVLDDGGSMDVDGFVALWSVATSQKRFSEGTNSRRPIGKFGVGKLATYLLAHELTYICKAPDGVIRAVTMDYRRIDDAEKGALHIQPVPLDVREITTDELEPLLSAVPGRERILELIASGVPGMPSPEHDEDEVGGADAAPEKTNDTWTLAVLSALKPQGQRLSVAWVRRLLRTSLPLGASIAVYFNDEPLRSSKTSIDVVTEWVLGPGLGIKTVSLPDGTPANVTEHSKPYPHVMVEGLGELSGRARLYAERISGGKSDGVELSNGFFVNIRGRVLKPEDPYFGLENLSHSVWSRFRATVRVDSLDSKLSVNREAVGDGPELRLLRAFLMKLFNRARSDYDVRTAGSWPDAGGILTEKWGALPFEPLRRVIDESVQSDSFPSFVSTPSKDRRAAVEQEWTAATQASSGEMITDVVIKEMGSDAALSHYDLETRSVVVNKSHPFAVEHQETSQQLRVLRDTAIVELLTDAFMVDVGLSSDQLMEIRTYRDRAFRLVAQVRRRSASQIAGLLLAATSHVKGFERIIGDALEHIGFDVLRLGASGEPEGIATAVVSRGEEDAKVAYTFNYDAKSVQKGKVQTGNVGTAGLARHRKDYSADHTLVVGPEFQAGALEDECELTDVTPMLASDLARLVMVTVGYGPISLVKFREVLALRKPKDVTTWVDGLIAEQGTVKHLSLGILVQALTALSIKNAERPDMLTCSLIAEQCRELLGRPDYPQRGHVQNAVLGLSLMAPNVIAINGWDVMLSAPPNKLAEMIASQINSIPDNYRYGMARGIVE